MALTKQQTETLTEAIKELQEIQVKLENKGKKTRDIKLDKQVEGIREVTGKLSTVLHPSGTDTAGTPAGPETEPAAETAPNTEAGGSKATVKATEEPKESKK